MNDPEQPAGTEDDRMAEVERRVERLENRPTPIERSRGMLGTLFPADSRRHFRAAGRSQLLALRSMLDHWIGRLDDDKADDDEPPGRERIRID